MTVIIKPIIPAKIAENSQTTQYVASGCKTIIDKFTATNYGAVAASLSVSLVTFTDLTANSNLTVKTRVLAAGETYMFPEIVGHMLGTGDFISTLASAAGTINIRASGREVT